MITGRDILYLSSIDWDFLWQGSQEIALRLAAQGNRVLFVDNSGVRAPRPSEAGRVMRRLSAWTRSGMTRKVREVAPRVYVYPPLVLPAFGPPAQRRLNAWLFATQLRSAMRHVGFEPTLIWTYLCTDTIEDLLGAIRRPGDGLVYYCGTDFRERVRNLYLLEESERAVAQASDVVFTNCADLADRLSPWNDNVHVFPPGVNLSLFDEGAANTAPLSKRIASLPRPIVGYVGGLHREVDVDLLAAMAEMRPGWSWVYVGGVQRDLGRLAALPNVHLLGARPHSELPAYIRAFDVCTVPYVRSRFTETVVPTKINEYLAAGKAVVASDLPTVCEFNAPHGLLVTVPPRLPEFLDALDAATQAPVDPAVVARRKQVAAEADWNTRLAQMTDLIEQRVWPAIARADSR